MKRLWNSAIFLIILYISYTHANEDTSEIQVCLLVLLINSWVSAQSSSLCWCFSALWWQRSGAAGQQLQRRAGCVTFLWFAGRSVSFVLRREAGGRVVEKYTMHACIFLLLSSTAVLHLLCEGVWWRAEGGKSQTLCATHPLLTLLQGSIQKLER